MKKLLATTAIALTAAMPVMAQSTNADATAEANANANANVAMSNETFYEGVQDAVMASDFIGKRVYASETEVEAGAEMAEADAEWDDIGEVSDVVISTNGDIEAVLVDVGGFLGIGEKTVAVNLSSLEMVSEGADSEDYMIVMQGNRAALEEAPAFNPDWNEMQQDAANATDQAMETTENVTDTAWNETAEAGAAVGAAASEAGDNMADAADSAADWTEEQAADAGAAMDEAGDEMSQEMAQAETEMDAAGDEAAANVDAATDGAMTEEATGLAGFTAEDLTGETVYGANDENVGSVDEVIVDEQMQITEVIVDVGGFLGLGAKQVALSPDDLDVTEDENGLTVRVSATQEELEAMPEYQG